MVLKLGLSGRETGASVLTHAGWGQGAWVSDRKGNMKVSQASLDHPKRRENPFGS